MSNFTILVVDSDAESRTSTRELLEREGYTVQEAPDASHALDIVRRREITLVVTELYLPSAGERCLLHAIRRSRALRRTNVLAHTRHSGPTDRAWAIAEGADGYVLKKSGTERLLAVVSRLGVPSRGRVARVRRARAAAAARGDTE